MKTSSRAATLALIVLCALAGPARAEVTPAGTGEPAFTRSTGNTQWFTVIPEPGKPNRVVYQYYDNNVLVHTETVATTATAPFTTWANWSGVLTLLHGHTYGICATNEYQDGGIWFPDGGSSCSVTGYRSSTTIDRSPPSTGISADAGKAFTNNPVLALHLSYQDDLSPPFPGNFLCVVQGACVSYDYNANCSQPAGALAKTTAFDCTVDLTAQADGAYAACVRGADSAVPDVPGSSNQTGTAQQANLSPAACTSITLDRVAPTVQAAADHATVEAGQPVAFTASGSDPSSGLSNQWTWAWGDGTAGGTGATPSHTFSQAGTYTATLSTTDNAGNAASAQVTVTVTAPPTTTPPDTGGGGTTTPDPVDGGSGDGDGVTPEPPGPPAGPVAGAAKGGKVLATLTAPQLARLARGAGTRSTVAGRLSVIVPRAWRLSSGPSGLPLLLTAAAPGRARFTLVRKGRTVARGALVMVRAGQTGFRLALPRGVRPGAYRLDVAFAADGALDGVTKRMTLLLRR